MTGVPGAARSAGVWASAPRHRPRPDLQNSNPAQNAQTRDSSQFPCL